MRQARKRTRTGAMAAMAVLAIAGCADPRRDDLRPDLPLPSGYDVDCEGGFDTPPRLLSGRSPIFPASTYDPEFVDDRKIRHLPLEWQVTTRFDVLADGRTANVRSSATEPPFFATHTNAAISGWRFEPARDDGRAVPARCVNVFRFMLER